MSPQNDRTTGNPRPAFWYRQTLLARLACFGVSTERLAQLYERVTPEESTALSSMLNSMLFNQAEQLHLQGYPEKQVRQAEEAANHELQNATDWIVNLHRRYLAARDAAVGSTEDLTIMEHEVGDGGNDLDLAV